MTFVPAGRSAGRPAADPGQWPVRLSDRLRAAINAGDLDEGRRIALHGDGMARSLADEFAMMFSGLCGTVRLIAGYHARTRPDTDPPPFWAQFREDLVAATAGVLGQHLDASPAGDGPTQLVALLGQVKSAFSARQAELAAQVVAALTCEDAGSALELLTIKEAGCYRPLHDLLVGFMAKSFSDAYAAGGRAGLAALHEWLADGQRAGIDAWEAMPARDFVRAFSYLLKQHHSDFRVREYPGYWLIDQTVCGTGGRLITGGAYTGESPLTIVEGPDPLTGGRASLPSYCTHCPAWNGAAPDRWYGHPHVVLGDPARPDGSCELRVPKRPPGDPRRGGLKGKQRDPSKLVGISGARKRGSTRSSACKEEESQWHLPDTGGLASMWGGPLLISSRSTVRPGKFSTPRS